MSETGSPGEGGPGPATACVRLEAIDICGYKAIDQIRLALPRARRLGEPDVTVIGGPDGAGKSAILEAIAIGLALGGGGSRRGLSRGDRVLAPALIRTGCAEMTMAATLASVTGRGMLRVAIGADGTLAVEADPRVLAWVAESGNSGTKAAGAAPGLGALVLRPAEMVALPFGLYFSAARRPTLEPDPPAVDDSAAWAILARLGRLVLGAPLVLIETGGPPGLGVVVGDPAATSVPHGGDHPTDAPADDFDDPDYRQGEARPWWCLGAGERALVALVYRVWAASRDRAALVLIDEPELHIHAERHRLLIRLLADVAPRNQYLLATLSPEVAAAVPARRRALVVPSRPRRPPAPGAREAAGGGTVEATDTGRLGAGELRDINGVSGMPGEYGGSGPAEAGPNEDAGSPGRTPGPASFRSGDEKAVPAASGALAGLQGPKLGSPELGSPEPGRQEPGSPERGAPAPPDTDARAGTQA